MNHCHHHCNHEKVKYCKDCKEVYCESCKQTWKEPCTLNHYSGWPYYTTTTPLTYPYVTCGAGTVSDTVTISNATPCGHLSEMKLK